MRVPNCRLLSFVDSLVITHQFKMTSARYRPAEYQKSSTQTIQHTTNNRGRIAITQQAEQLQYLRVPSPPPPSLKTNFELKHFVNQLMKEEFKTFAAHEIGTAIPLPCVKWGSPI
jgi:hypothetical protein